MSVPACAHSRSAWNHALFVAAASLLAAAFVLVSFFPRLHAWRYLEGKCQAPLPEVNRAYDTLQQLHNPGIRITNPSNEVINWRLLFPTIGHRLGMPDSMFLALPHFGCLLVLALLVHVIRRAGADDLLAFLATALLATTSWFFVSTSWLAYFDSWLVLGLLIVAFADSRRLLAAATVLTPWVDERFLIALPLSLTVRVVWRLFRDDDSRASLRGDLALVAGLAAGYLVIRGVLMSGRGDATTRSYLQNLFPLPAGPLRYLYGAWSGYRVAWVLFPVLFFLLGRRLTWLPNTLLAIVTAVTLAFSLIIAGDLSRNTTAVIPVAALAVLVLVRSVPRRIAVAVLAYPLMLNWLLPAAHVITVFEVPIDWSLTEIKRFRRPTPRSEAELSTWKSECLASRQEMPEALAEINRAIEADPEFADAYVIRARLRLLQGDRAEGVRDFTQYLRMRGESAHVYTMRGAAYEEMGMFAEAIGDFRRALEIAPAEWQLRELVHARLSELTKKMP